MKYINMKYNQGHCYAKTHWYEASVVFFEDTDKEITIECSIEVNEDDNINGEIINITVLNPEDIPEGYFKDDVTDFVNENFE